MSTEKSIKIQKNKVLTYSVNKSGFKTVYGSTVVSENQTINVEMKNLNSETGAFQLGDRLFGISSFVDYFTPDTENGIDKDSLKYISATQTTGTGLTDIQVIKGTSTAPASEETGTWLSKVERDLNIITDKGTSNNFIFTYNGSTWDITGALTLAGQNLEDFGISFEGTATSGNVITVVETQYNRFAFFVLDANYRSNSGQSSFFPAQPVQYNSSEDLLTVPESSSYFNNWIWNNTDFSNSIFNVVKNLGSFILNNNIKLNAMIPTSAELKIIYNNRVDLDSYDQSGSVNNRLSDWSFDNNAAWTCIQGNPYSRFWELNSGGNFNSTAYYEGNSRGIVPIFEVPVM